MHACAVYGGQPLKAESGFLMPGHLHQSVHQSTAAVSTLQGGAVASGTAGCPWMIRAKPGQRVNLTLLNVDRDTTVSSLVASHIDTFIYFHLHTCYS